MFSKNSYKFNGDLFVNINYNKGTYFGRKMRIHFRPLLQGNSVFHIMGIPPVNFAQNVKHVGLYWGDFGGFKWSVRSKRYGLLVRSPSGIEPGGMHKIGLVVNTMDELWDIVFQMMGNEEMEKFDRLFLSGDDDEAERLGKSYFGN